MKNLIKIILFGIPLLFITSCDTQRVVLNREVDTTNYGKMLLGTQTKSQFSKEPYATWYKPEYEQYSIDQIALAELKKKKFNTYSLTIFLGTWCEDSHREFPRLMKILDALNYPEERMTIIAVNRKKESPTGEEATHNLQKVPTIIVTKYGKELGRIIEIANSGYLERDLLEIVNKYDNSFSVKDILKK